MICFHVIEHDNFNIVINHRSHFIVFEKELVVSRARIPFLVAGFGGSGLNSAALHILAQKSTPQFYLRIARSTAISQGSHVASVRESLVVKILSTCDLERFIGYSRFRHPTRKISFNAESMKPCEFMKKIVFFSSILPGLFFVCITRLFRIGARGGVEQSKEVLGEDGGVIKMSVRSRVVCEALGIGSRKKML